MNNTTSTRKRFVFGVLLLAGGGIFLGMIGSHIFSQQQEKQNPVDTFVETRILQEENEQQDDSLGQEDENDKELVPLSEEQQEEQEGKDKAEEQELPEPFQFVVLGDSENESAQFGFDEDVLESYAAARNRTPDIVFFTGDIINSGGDAGTARPRIQHIKNLFAREFPNIPTRITFGWHDIECGAPCVDLWRSIYFEEDVSQTNERTFYYSFDHENTHFVLLSTDFPQKRTIDSAQFQWLENDLKQTDKEHIIVLSHVPPVTFFKESAKDCHDFTCSPGVSARLQSIFQTHGVDLVISGHENVFDHKIINSVHYALSGNPGGSRVKYDGPIDGKNFTEVRVSGKTIILQALTPSGELIREIRVK